MHKIRHQRKLYQQNFLRLIFVNAVHDECNCIDGKETVGEATV